jgi:hypothetical protein
MIHIGGIDCVLSGVQGPRRRNAKRDARVGGTRRRRDGGGLRDIRKRERRQVDIRHALFYLAGIDESNGEIFITCFLVRLERQLYGLENDRRISHVTCCHGYDK